MSDFIYIEGGASGPYSKGLSILCQKAFHQLLDRMGFRGRKPKLVACGGRSEVFERFRIAHARRGNAYVAMWIDSEEPLAEVNAAWEHLRMVTTVPPWDRPEDAADEQVLFMSTCMESWIVADRETLRIHFGSRLQVSVLPSLHGLETKSRDDVQDRLTRATRNCTNAYQKGRRSFEVLGKLNPDALQECLPSFVRVRRILNEKL